MQKCKTTSFMAAVSCGVAHCTRRLNVHMPARARWLCLLQMSCELKSNMFFFAFHIVVEMTKHIKFNLDFTQYISFSLTL